MLAWALDAHPDELYADFWQFYHLDLWLMDIYGDECTPDVLRASVLAAQLPRESRVYVAADQRVLITLTDELLRQIEFNQRAFMTAFSKNASEPERIEFPGEEAAYKRAVERAAGESRYIAEAFGLQGLEVAT